MSQVLISRPYYDERGGWVLAFDKARTYTLMFFDAREAWKKWSEAVALKASGWSLNKFVSEWF